MCFNNNSIINSNFGIKENKNNFLNTNNTTHKVVISEGLNGGLKKRSKYSISEDDNLNFLIYTRDGISVPLGKYSDALNFGIYSQGIIEVLFQNKFAAGISIGEYFYFGNFFPTDNGVNLNSSQSPFSNVFNLAATLKYFLLEDNFKPYIGVDLGLFLKSVDLQYEFRTTFGGTPRIGFNYYIAEILFVGLDASCNIDDNFNDISIGVQIGFIF
jgi:hypothetical protein